MKKRNVALGELFNVGSSKRVLKSQWQTEGVPFYRGREITRLSADGFVNNELFISENDYAEYASKYGVPTPGDIVITAIGTIGNSYIVREGDRFYFKDASVLWLNKDAEVSSEFINLWLKSPLFFDQLDKGNGATVDTLTIKRLKGVLVDLPPLPEQKRIVAILDEAFAGIDAAVANTEKNLANGRELFESYLNGVFTRKGEGWVEKTIADLCIIGDGNHSSKYPKKSEMIEAGIPFIRGTNLIDGTISAEDILFISEKKHQDLKKGHLQTNDILFTNRGEIGKVAIVDEAFNGANLNSQIAWLRCKTELLPEYLFFFLQSGLMKRHFSQTQSGAALQQFTIKMIKAVVISYPQKSKQEQIVDRLRVLSTEVIHLESIYQQKLIALAELKQSILQKAFASELTTLPEKTLAEAVA